MSKKYPNEIYVYFTYLFVTSIALSQTIFIIIDKVRFELRVTKLW
jgi:hypothetical protein